MVTKSYGFSPSLLLVIDWQVTNLMKSRKFSEFYLSLSPKISPLSIILESLAFLFRLASGSQYWLLAFPAHLLGLDNTRSILSHLKMTRIIL